MTAKRLKRKPLRIIKAGEIKQHYSMNQAIDAMYKAFSLLSSGDSFVPSHYVNKLPSEKLWMIFKPACVEKENRLSIKILTQREQGYIQGIPVIQGIVMVIDAETGEILSLMDGEYITALRTGAASGLATRFFARKDSKVLALFGCGAQGITQLEAVLCERQIKKVFIFDKNRNSAFRFIDEMQDKTDAELVFCKDTSILAEVDIICTATDSTSPLFKREEVKKGVHINAIGSFQPHMQELDPVLLSDAKIYFDLKESCLRESGDFINPLSEGLITDKQIVGEIGDYCLNKIPGRESDDEITIYKSVGVAIQDYAVATDIYNFALNEGFGRDFNLFG
ncbi:MAG: ornithine cyclodeaminase [Bacteroidetes bacterium]|nr:MAG: ornithine cyclodeaminase [Bacteroidota bacterium]